MKIIAVLLFGMVYVSAIYVGKEFNYGWKYGEGISK
jgi:hypothetical protein